MAAVGDFVRNYTGSHGYGCGVCFPPGWLYPQARNSRPHEFDLLGNQQPTQEQP